MKKNIKKIYNYARYLIIKLVYFLSNKKYFVREYWALTGVENFSENIKKYWEKRGASFVNEARRRQIINGKFIPDARQLKTKKFLDEFGVRSASLLDLGCGFGRNIRFFYEYCHITDLTGVDFSFNILRTAKKYLKKYNCKLYNADIGMLPFGDNSFELIYAFGVFTYIKPDQLENVLKEILRVTSKYVVFSEIAYDENAVYNWLGWDGSYKHNYKKVLQRINGLKIAFNEIVEETDTFLLEKDNKLNNMPHERNLICLKCGEKLNFTKRAYMCLNCSQEYKIKENIPIFLIG